MNPIDGLNTFTQNISAWGKQPFTSPMNAGSWFLFTGLVVVAAIAWLMILKDLKGHI